MVRGVFSIDLGLDSDSKKEAAGSPRAFIAGQEHQPIRKALELVLKRGGECNPLVIYGPTGTGKSLLARGLLALWRDKFPRAQCQLVTAADWARSYANAVDAGGIDDWRTRFAQADLWILEDIERLQGKATIQEELVQLLDHAVERPAPLSQVVITAKSPPHAWELSRRLIGRLQAGLPLCLPLPRHQTRIGMLEYLAQQRGMQLPRKVVTELVGEDPPAAVAERQAPFATFPQLQHALNQLQLLAKTRQQPISPQLVELLMADHLARREPEISEIASCVARYFQYRASDLKGPKRQRGIVQARGIAMFLSRKLTTASLEKVGSFFGGRDHTTVLHACRKTEESLENDPALRAVVDAFLEQLSTASARP